jgi:hypothetical protein
MRQVHRTDLGWTEVYKAMHDCFDDALGSLRALLIDLRKEHFARELATEYSATRLMI